MFVLRKLPLSRRNPHGLSTAVRVVARFDALNGAHVLVAPKRHTCHATRPVLQSWARRVARPWMCLSETCRFVNPSKASDCESCGKQKPVLSGWQCDECDTKNHAGIKFCRKCAAAPPKDVWRCAACGKNNIIDEIEDNSTCGHCGYNMAPLSRSEQEILDLGKQRYEDQRSSQEHFDSIPAKEADEQMGDETGDFDAKNPSSWAQPVKPTASKPSWSSPSGNSESEEPEAVQPAQPVLSHTQKEVAKILGNSPIKPFSFRSSEPARSQLTRGKANREKYLHKTATAPPGFDWMCRDLPCGTVNGGDDLKCSSCTAAFSPKEWECPCCAATNHPSRAQCFSCHSPIPVSWACPECKAMTSVYDNVCRSCSAARPAAVPRTKKQAGEYFKQPQRSRVKKADWSCPSCHMLNFASRSTCFKCDTEKPGTSKSAASGWGDEMTADSISNSSRAPQGDTTWLCTSCGTSNFRTRTTCWQCNKEASSAQRGGWEETATSVPKIDHEGFQGGDDVPMSPGQVKGWGSRVVNSDDWTCSKCFSKNYKNKTECFKCGAAKSVLAAPRKAFAKKAAKI
mmetsp:Transcript_78857/g.92168  ORF Transcript_78857/g.92168 Transcript_78857/m.92168 type:complete len:569 (-) Transcript_78857:45-1751(-)